MPPVVVPPVVSFAGATVVELPAIGQAPSAPQVADLRARVEETAEPCGRSRSSVRRRGAEAAEAQAEAASEQEPAEAPSEPTC